MKFEAFYGSILPEVIGCPDPMVNARITAAAAEFCREALVWNEVQDPFALEDGVYDYDLDVPPGAFIVTVMDVWSNDRLLSPTSTKLPFGASLEPSHFRVSEFNTLRVFPTPSAPTASLKVHVAYAPLMTATSLPDSLVRFVDAIASGAKADLMLMPAVPWSNPNLATYYRQKFLTSIADCRISEMHSRVNSSLTVAPRMFI